MFFLSFQVYVSISVAFFGTSVASALRSLWLENKDGLPFLTDFSRWIRELPPSMSFHQSKAREKYGKTVRFSSGSFFQGRCQQSTACTWKSNSHTSTACTWNPELVHKIRILFLGTTCTTALPGAVAFFVVKGVKKPRFSPRDLGPTELQWFELHWFGTLLVYSLQARFYGATKCSQWMSWMLMGFHGDIRGFVSYSQRTCWSMSREIRIIDVHDK